jgi:ABC-type transport system involved in cytochrome bd biosynthesis fused ATPase/permease subunit
MIDTEQIQTLWGQIRWFVLFAFCAVLAYVARGFGSSSKQEKYKETLDQYRDKKLDDILVREQLVIEQRDSKVEAQAEEARARAAEKELDMVRLDNERRAMVRGMTPREISEALNK